MDMFVHVQIKLHMSTSHVADVQQHSVFRVGDMQQSNIQFLAGHTLTVYVF